MRIQLLLLLSVSGSVLKAQKTDSLPPRVYRWDSLITTIEDTRTRKEIMEGSTTSLVYFEVHASMLQPGKAPHPPHTHADQEELIIVKEGQVKITINGAATDATVVSVDEKAGKVTVKLPGQKEEKTVPIADIIKQ